MEEFSQETICSQLLSKDDLNISKDILDRVKEDSLVTSLHISQAKSFIKIYSHKKLYLSNITPLLHDFSFTIVDEIAYEVVHDKKNIYITKFNLDAKTSQEMAKASKNIEQVISDSLLGNIYSKCKIFSMVSKQNINIKEVYLLRAIIEYIDQSVIDLNSNLILETLTSYDDISKLFIDYFIEKFDPSIKSREKALDVTCQKIVDKIKKVPNILDDRILKLTFELLKNLLRTNYFFNQDAIAFKIDTASFSKNLKGLQPRIESFVYHPEFSGLHLRMSKISRGGLRWSERADFRTEVKSLMTTQEGKNSIIIPDGAKGGFVIRKQNIDKEYFTKIYTMFINNLLDLVDNMKDGKVVKNADIVAYDEDDAYFVVAADKGTASMSDVANSIAIERAFWLGDAFASGGSNGYGHKELGITAKGALKSSQRFFIENGVDYYKEQVSVIGIGSMNGDVFGNGLIETSKFILKAAISHKEVFVDPNPDEMVAFNERKRLFEAPKGGWSEYNQELISKGGGVFLRSSKTIELSDEIKKLIDQNVKTLSGEELAKALLSSKCDMMFNGGVGTYFKSSEESNLDLGDKQNEAVRVDAIDLKATIVCEGGNLGFTQKARIEFARAGGQINIDGIDNAAGVDTSDHEVNLKILLNSIEEKGLINKEESTKVLKGLTDQIVNMVLWSNYRQSLALSKDQILSKTYKNDFIKTIEILEDNVEAFKRKDFYIPKNESISSILDFKGQFVRPVLSSLLSYAKIFIKTKLLESTMIDEPFALDFLFKYFPKSFVSAYEHEVKHHPLAREIKATMIADKIINNQGSSFIAPYKELGDEKFLLMLKAYIYSNELFGSNDIRHDIFREDFNMNVSKQYALLSEIEHTVNFSTKWMIKYLNSSQLDASHMFDYKDELFDLLSDIKSEFTPTVIKGNEKVNRFFSVIPYLRFAVAAIMIKENSKHNFKNVATLFYLVVKEFNILELLQSLDDVKINQEVELKLKNQLMQFLEFIVVHYSQKILDFQRVDENSKIAFENFIDNEKESFKSIKEQIKSFESLENKGLKDIAVTVNQLMASAI